MDFQCSTLNFAPIKDKDWMGDEKDYKEHALCIPYNLTCDGIDHCPDGSDENSRYVTYIKEEYKKKNIFNYNFTHQ